MNRESALRLIASFAGQDQILTIPKSFLKVMDGDFPSALLLSQLVYWQDIKDRDPDSDGWIAKSQQDWEDEICLSRRMLSRAASKLEGMGLIERTKRKSAYHQHAPTAHYRINWDALLKTFEAHFSSPSAQNVQMEVHETCNSDLHETCNSYKHRIQHRVQQRELSEATADAVGRATVDVSDDTPHTSDEPDPMPCEDCGNPSRELIAGKDDRRRCKSCDKAFRKARKDLEDEMFEVLAEFWFGFVPSTPRNPDNPRDAQRRKEISQLVKEAGSGSRISQVRNWLIDNRNATMDDLRGFYAWYNRTMTDRAGNPLNPVQNFTKFKEYWTRYEFDRKSRQRTRTQPRRSLVSETVPNYRPEDVERVIDMLKRAAGE